MARDMGQGTGDGHNEAPDAPHDFICLGFQPATTNTLQNIASWLTVQNDH